MLAPSTSEPSTSFVARLARIAIQLSSKPCPNRRSVTCARSARGATSTAKEARVTAVPPAASLAVATNVKGITPAKSAGGASVRFASSLAVRRQAPSASRWPAERLAPGGTPRMRSARLSEPSRSARAAVRFRAMTPSSSPAASCTVTTGASATAATCTVSPAVTLRLAVGPSSTTASRVRANSPSLWGGGITLMRPAASSARSSAQAPAASAWPWLSTAPSGRPRRITVSPQLSVASPSVPKRDCRVIARSSSPLAVTTRLAPSTSGATVTVTRCSARAVSPLAASVAVALNVRVKLPE